MCKVTRKKQRSHYGRRVVIRLEKLKPPMLIKDFSEIYKVAAVKAQGFEKRQ